MDDDARARLIGLELAALILRVEALPPHADYTRAGEALVKARDAVGHGRSALHHERLRETYGGG